MSTVEPTLAKISRPGPQRLSLRWLFPRCENDRCVREGKLWPPIRRRSSGIHLDGHWLCGAECFEKSVANVLMRTAAPSRWTPQTHRLPIGLVLLSRGTIRDDQLRDALDRQRLEGGRRLGTWLRQAGAVSEDDITAALAAQWACPVFPLARERNFLHCAAMLPMAVIRAARMLPVYLSRDQSSVYIAFVDGIDHSWLLSAEQMLGCRTIPCLVSESSFVRALEEVAIAERPEEFTFDSVTEVREMSRITTSFAIQLQAKSVRVVGCREFAWARIHSEGIARDILFRLPIAV